MRQRLKSTLWRRRLMSSYKASNNGIFYLDEVIAFNWKPSTEYDNYFDVIAIYRNGLIVLIEPRINSIPLINQILEYLNMIKQKNLNGSAVDLINSFNIETEGEGENNEQ